MAPDGGGGELRLRIRPTPPRQPLIVRLPSRHLLLLAGTSLVFGTGASRPASAQSAREYDAIRVTRPPVIDGRLDDDAWAGAPWTEPFIDIRSEGHPTPPWTTRAKIVWDAEAVYFAARLEEPHLWATLIERDAIVYRDHDFEVFLDPDGDGNAYFEIEINALGTVFDLFLDQPYREGGRAFIGWDARGIRTAVHLEGTLNDPSDVDRGWTVEIAVPFDALSAPEDAGVEAKHAAPLPGDVWRVNFSRVHWPLEIVDGGYLKAATPSREAPHPEENWVWSPQGEINMHIPERWGFVRFVEERR